MPDVPTPLAQAADTAKGYLKDSTAKATRRAYRSDWKIFGDWCAAQGVDTLPASPETVAIFLAAQADAGIAPATLSRRLAAIRFAHEGAGHGSPAKSKVVRSTLRGIRRARGAALKQKAPATAPRIMEMVAHCPSNLTGLRDKALLLLGFAGAFRRSELAALTVADLQEVPEGLRVTVRKSKTDQEGHGHTVPILNGARLKAAEAVKAWLAAAGIQDGPLFRPIRKGGKVRAVALADGSIAALVKRYAAKAGFDPSEFAGHSLRAGFLTSAAESGASLFKMMAISRHRKIDTLRGYVRSAEMFKDHAGSAFL
jgi:site-specific recombinase XerD